MKYVAKPFVLHVLLSVLFVDEQFVAIVGMEVRNFQSVSHAIGLECVIDVDLRRESLFSGEMWIRLVLFVDYPSAAAVGITAGTSARNVATGFLIISFQERQDNAI